jgi:hypothetical protein
VIGRTVSVLTDSDVDGYKYVLGAVIDKVVPPRVNAGVTAEKLPRSAPFPIVSDVKSASSAFDIKLMSLLVDNIIYCVIAERDTADRYILGDKVL